MDGRVFVVVFWAAVAVGGCAQDNPLFGLGGTETETNGVADTTGLVAVEDTGVDDTRGTAGHTADPIDPTTTDDDDDSIETGDDDDDDDDDDDVGTDTGPGCPPASDCTLDNDSCQNDEKCTVYGDIAGGPDAIGCTPLHPTPVPLGRQCQVNGCGFDDCDLGLVCPRDDDSAVCIPLCSPSDSSCGGVAACINVTGPGAAVGVCAPSCDPVEQNCLVSSDGCYLDAMALRCVPAGVAGLYEPCAVVNGCVPGLACVPGTVIDACMGMPCCTEYCTVGDATCPDALQCAPAKIPGAPTVGVCID